jgi:hypothetical protein
MQTFDVLFSEQPDSAPQQINEAPLLSSAFLHARRAKGGAYVVEAKSLDGEVARSSPFER